MSKPKKQWIQDEPDAIPEAAPLPADITGRVWFSMSRVPGRGNVAVHRLGFDAGVPTLSVVVDEDLPDFALGRLSNSVLEELMK